MVKVLSIAIYLDNEKDVWLVEARHNCGLGWCVLGTFETYEEAQAFVDENYPGVEQE